MKPTEVICEHHMEGNCNRKDAHLCAYHSKGKCNHTGYTSDGHWPEQINYGDR